MNNLKKILVLVLVSRERFDENHIIMESKIFTLPLTLASYQTNPFDKGINSFKGVCDSSFKFGLLLLQAFCNHKVYEKQFHLTCASRKICPFCTDILLADSVL